MTIKLKNNASAVIATQISASDVGVVLQAGTGALFPTLASGDYFYATLESPSGAYEIVKATARVGDTLTIVRAQEGTTANSFPAGARFELRITAQSVFDVARTTQINVLSYGADPTGVNDSTAAFVAANADAITGGAIYVPQGTYRLDTDVSISNKRVIAYGATFTGGGTLNAPLLETVSGFVVRAGSYLAAGKAANTDGAGKGGVLVGGGTARSPNGVWLSLDGTSNWLVAQTSKNENPTELIIYGSSGQGYATTVLGTNRITRVWGSPFQSRWVGNTIYFLRKKFRVVAVLNSDTLSVSELGGQSVTFPIVETEAYNYVYTTGSGLCNVNGTTITYVSGDPFVPLFFTDFQFTLNGTPVTLASQDSVTQYTAVSPPGNGVNVPYTWRGNINDQLTTFRVQAIQGSNEENVNILSIAGDNFLGRHYAFVTGTAGTYGRYRPIFIGSGSYTDSSYQHQLGCYPRDVIPGVSNQGYVSLGGVQGREGVRVLTPNASTPLANRFETQAAASGLAPAWRARGSDTNVSFGIDMQGTGELRVTQDFSRTLLRVFGGVGVVNWFDSVSAVSGFAPAWRAVGADASVSMGLDMKGSGELRITQDFARTLLKVQGGASTVNSLAIAASTSGGATSISVDPLSADTNVGIEIVPKGTGVVRFGRVGGSIANVVATQPSPTGVGVGIRAEGSDTNIDVDISTKGEGEFRVTQSYTRTLFKAQGSLTSVNWLTAVASATNTRVLLAAQGADTNIDIHIAPKGTGRVAIGNVTGSADAPVIGYIPVKDYAGNLVKLAVIA